MYSKNFLVMVDTTLLRIANKLNKRYFEYLKLSVDSHTVDANGNYRETGGETK